MFKRLSRGYCLAGIDSWRGTPCLCGFASGRSPGPRYSPGGHGPVQGVLGHTAFEMITSPRARAHRHRRGGGILFGQGDRADARVLEKRLPKKKNEALYELAITCAAGRSAPPWRAGSGRHACWWPLIRNSTIVDDVRSDPLLARFFLEVMGEVSRLITDEGGWGHLEFEVKSQPLRVFLTNSQEAAWLGPSQRPVCHLYAGIVAGYTSAISGEELRACEVECRAMGAERCVFEIDR